MSDLEAAITQAEESKTPQQLASERRAEEAHAFMKRMSVKGAVVAVMKLVMAILHAAVVPATVTMALIASDDDFTRYYKFLGAHSGPGFIVHTWTMLGICASTCLRAPFIRDPRKRAALHDPKHIRVSETLTQIMSVASIFFSVGCLTALLHVDGHSILTESRFLDIETRMASHDYARGELAAVMRLFGQPILLNILTDNRFKSMKI